MEIQEIVEEFNAVTLAMQEDGMEPTYETVAILVAAGILKRTMEKCTTKICGELDCIRI
jgi:hypothetical protein